MAETLSLAEEARRRPRLRTLVSQHPYKERFDRRHRDAYYAQGDLVWLSNLQLRHGACKKISAYYACLFFCF